MYKVQEIANTDRKLESTLIPRKFPLDSKRAERSKSRDLCKRTMDDTGEDVPVSQHPSSSATENKVKINHTEDMDVTILTNYKRYSRKTKV